MVSSFTKETLVNELAIEITHYPAIFEINVSQISHSLRMAQFRVINNFTHLGAKSCSRAGAKFSSHPAATVTIRVCPTISAVNLR